MEKELEKSKENKIRKKVVINGKEYTQHGIVHSSRYIILEPKNGKGKSLKITFEKLLELKETDWLF